MRKLWRRLRYRKIWLESYFSNGWAGTASPVWVGRWESRKPLGYYFEAQVRRPEWGEWRTVGMFPQEIRDESGRLVSLRVDADLFAGEQPTDSTFYIDGPSLRRLT